jgi:EpsI family protein
LKNLLENWLRFFLAIVLLAGTSLLLQGQGKVERLPPRQGFGAFPMKIGGWVGAEVGIQPDVREVLGEGDFLERLYHRPGEPVIDLFLAYFPSQRAGSTMHSPQNCLPGAGWTPVGQTLIQVSLPDGDPIVVNRYLVAKGMDRQLVLYWYQIHGRVVGDEYRAKFFLVSDSIWMNRRDGALSRIATPLAANENVDAGQQRAVGFARQLFPLLESYIPR